MYNNFQQIATKYKVQKKLGLTPSIVTFLIMLQTVYYKPLHKIHSFLIYVVVNFIVQIRFLLRIIKEFNLKIIKIHMYEFNIGVIIEVKFNELKKFLERMKQMTIESVKKHIEEAGYNLNVIELEASTATVELAASALGVEPARIAKTMAFSLKDKNILILAKGDVKIDNRKFKDYFKEKARFIKPEEVMDITGHPIGGVCPFGLSNPLDIYLDISLQSFDYVFPAGGSPNTCIKITVDYLCEVTKGTWIDVCKE